MSNGQGVETELKFLKLFFIPWLLFSALTTAFTHRFYVGTGWHAKNVNKSIIFSFVARLMTAFASGCCFKSFFFRLKSNSQLNCIEIQRKSFFPSKPLRQCLCCCSWNCKGKEGGNLHCNRLNERMLRLSPSTSFSEINFNLSTSPRED